MELTEDQKLQIEKNRQAALAKKLLKESANTRESTTSVCSADSNKDFDVLCCQALLENSNVCRSAEIDEDMMSKFNEPVCKRCRIHNADYDLLNKKQAQAEYLITNDSLDLMLFSTKNNPLNSNWIPMKLYLRKHCRVKSLHRFGTETALQAEIHRRQNQVFEKKLEKIESDMSMSKRARENVDGSDVVQSGILHAHTILVVTQLSIDSKKLKARQPKATIKKYAGLISSITSDN